MCNKVSSPNVLEKHLKQIKILVGCQNMLLSSYFTVRTKKMGIAIPLVLSCQHCICSTPQPFFSKERSVDNLHTWKPDHQPQNFVGSWVPKPQVCDLKEAPDGQFFLVFVFSPVTVITGSRNCLNKADSVGIYII